MLIGKHGDLRKKLSEATKQEVEVKKDVSHRINKTDYVITVDFKNQYQAYQKVNHLIVLTTEIEREKVFRMATKLHTEDIIFFEETIEYIANRIKEVIKR